MEGVMLKYEMNINKKTTAARNWTGRSWWVLSHGQSDKEQTIAVNACEEWNSTNKYWENVTVN